MLVYIYTLGHVYNSAPTLWRPSRLHDGLDRSVGDSINVHNILESVDFLVFYDFFKPSELCRIFPKNTGNGISETLDFKIFRGVMPPDPSRRSPPFQILATFLYTEVWQDVLLLQQDALLLHGQVCKLTDNF